MKTIDTIDHPDRARTTDTVAEPRDPGGRAAPTGPPDRPSDPLGTAGRERPARRTVLAVAALATVAALGVAGTIVGFTTGGGTTTDDGEVTALQQQLSEALSERDEAATAADEAAAREALVRAQIGGVTAERDRLADLLATAEGDADELRASVARLDRRIGELGQELDTAAVARDEAEAQVERLESVVTLARSQATSALAERDAIARRFPLTVEPALDVADVVGTYGLTWQEQFCSGLPSCSTLPQIRTAAMTTTTEGYLRLQLGSMATTNLGRVPGGFHAVTDSTTAVPSCDGAARRATVTTTVYPHRISVETDGDAEVTSWAGAVTIQAAASGSCPAVLAMYGVRLATTA